MPQPPELLAALASSTGLTSEQCESATGTLLAALQLSLPAAQYAEVERAIPGAGRLTGRSVSPLSGRTGEVAAVMAQLRTPEGAERMAEYLTRRGFTVDQVRHATDAFVNHLQGALGNQQVERMLADLPGLKRLMA